MLMVGTISYFAFAVATGSIFWGVMAGVGALAMAGATPVFPFWIPLLIGLGALMSIVVLKALS